MVDCVHAELSTIPLQCFFSINGDVALDRNPWMEYNTLLLPLILGDLYIACPHRQFHTLPDLLDSQAALSNSYPNACVPSREAICTIIMMVLNDQAGYVTRQPYVVDA